MTTEKLTRTEINCETGEVTIVELTTEEIAALEAFNAEYSARKAEEEAQAEALAALKVSAKAKLVAGQPLTEEEAAVLVI
jgi:Asp-tRNA(Asn)/Glu-tRNA(Gln) amidotransferase A subunit family amidase